jgi:hypothetical protein
MVSTGKLSKFAQVTEQVSDPQVSARFRQLPPPVHERSQMPSPQLTTPSLHEPPLPQEMVQSLSEQLTVVP